MEGWNAEISMQRIGEDGVISDNVPIDTIRVSSDDLTVGCEDGIARLVAEDDDSLVEFEGESKPVGDGVAAPVSIGETRLEIRAELRTSGGE